MSNDGKFCSPVKFPTPDCEVTGKFSTSSCEVPTSKTCGPLILPTSTCTESKTVSSTTSCSNDSAIIALLTSLKSILSGSVDSEMVVLCDPDTSAPILVRARYSFVNGTQTTIPVDAWNLDGSAYTGVLTDLVSCSGGVSPGGSGSILAEYFICDDGTQKIVQLCGTACNTLTVSYLLLDRTASTEPVDWNAVTEGNCLDVQNSTYLQNIVTNTTNIAFELGLIDAKIPALGQALSAASLPVVLASDQSAIPVTIPGTVGVTQSTSPWVVSGTTTVNQGTSPWVVSGTVTANAGTNLNTSALALESGGNLAAIKTDVDRIPAQGAALIAASMPVNIASNQTVPVSAVSLPLPPDAATETAQDTQTSYLTLIYDILLSGVNSLLNAVNYPSYVDRSLQRARGTTIVESGTITSVGTVTTVTNLAQLATYQAQLPVMDLSRASWAVNVRARYT